MAFFLITFLLHFSTSAIKIDSTLIHVPVLAIRPQGSSIDFSSDFTTCTDPNSWAPTYDDGPSSYTSAVLSKLASLKVNATFFVIGSVALNYPDILLQAHQAGHQIGIHTWSHPYLTNISNDQIVSEIIWTAKIIHEIIGVTPKTVRPPYGDIDARVRTILKAMNLTIVAWNRDSFDWAFSFGSPGNSPGSPYFNNDTASIAIPKYMKSMVDIKPNFGSISLQHDGFQLTSSAISSVLDILANSTYKIVSVAECIGQPIMYDRKLLDMIVNVRVLTKPAPGEVIVRGTLPTPSSSPYPESDPGESSFNKIQSLFWTTLVMLYLIF